MELFYQVALTFVPQVGAVTTRNLLSHCGSAQAVYERSARELLKIPGVGPQIAAQILTKDSLRFAEEEMTYMEKEGIEAIFYTDDRYPPRLRQCSDAPVLLYFKGSSADLLNATRMVAVVGTRKPSDYGRMICEDMMEGLKAYGVVVVSGLAYGIDVTAHKKATALGIPNIGVLGHGLGRIYPESHRPVAEKMLENGGLLSEYPHNVPPDREHFPMRNRLIVGLADCLLVVETPAGGGSMISADLAMQYQREMFAVPGRAKDAKSAGCNQLIKAGNAHLVEEAADIAQAMKWLEEGRPQAIQTQLFLDLSPGEARLVDLVRQRPEIPIDELHLAAALPAGELASLILGLEFKGVLRTLPGKRYVLTA